MINVEKVNTRKLKSILSAAEQAARAIPPVWPLASSVAVNPFLGQTADDLPTTAARLERVAGVSITMPRGWYQDKINAGDITDADLQDALEACQVPEGITDLQALKSAAFNKVAPSYSALKTIADLAADVSGIDWPAFIAERLGGWCASHFDVGQSFWVVPKRKGTYREWRAVALHDLTPEIAGMNGFAEFVSNQPENSEAVISKAVDELGLAPKALETYFHQLLLGLGGWAQYARYKLWDAEMAEQTDTTLIGLLAIRLTWEQALFEQYGAHIAPEWTEVAEAHAQTVVASDADLIDTVLQTAAERGEQRRMAEAFALSKAPANDVRPALQAAYCIDVRSEVYRRSLESVDPRIETIGFAGFFGLSVQHKQHASDTDENRCPVLLNPSVTTHAGDSDEKRFTARAQRAYGRFKLAAVSSFAFVEAMGPVYVGKLVRDALGLVKKDHPHDPMPKLETELDLSGKVGAAEAILRAMSLTSNFARVVVMAGHGANVTNNPHESALHCGACGGYSGEVNARLLAGLLNDAEVRAELKGKGIDIPSDTLFLGALHDTTTDTMVLYEDDVNISSHRSDMVTLKSWFAKATDLARTERALRLPGAETAEDIPQRSKNWAEVRPEWGLAGCKAFVAAPRGRTSGLTLDGRSFLHSYDWKQDEVNGFGVLELIMTAPVVVASWISLQYYGSTVAPTIFGGGNKLLHNVTGGIGVLEGNGGVLRAGLPWQSVHDGENYIHDPLRLSVVIEAPTEAMSAILDKHPGVKDLFDNGWLHLFALDEDGQMTRRYMGDLKWSDMEIADAEHKAATAAE